MKNLFQFQMEVNTVSNYAYSVFTSLYSASLNTMYAVISTGGKQYRVEQGQRLLVERLGEINSDVELTPVMLVDGDSVLAPPESLTGS